MKSILIATDLSERSEMALERALLLARATGAKLEIIHVVDDGQPSKVADEAAARAQMMLDDQVRDLSASIRVQVIFGQPWRGLVARVEQAEPDLLVMGAHRDRGLLDFFAGSVLHKAVALSPVPVLTVASMPKGPYRHASAGTNFSGRDALAARCAAELAPEARLRLVHAYHIAFRGLTLRSDSSGDISKHDREAVEAPIRAQMARVVALLATSGLEVDPVIREGGPVPVLLADARDNDTQLLAIGQHSHEGSFPRMMGRTASELLSYLPCDLLIHPGAQPRSV